MDNKEIKNKDLKDVQGGTGIKPAFNEFALAEPAAHVPQYLKDAAV